MDDWTKKEDMEADERCPDSCFWDDCDREATEGVALGYDFGNLYGAPPGGDFKWTPWQYFCEGCGERYTYGHVMEKLRGIRTRSVEAVMEEEE